MPLDALLASLEADAGRTIRERLDTAHAEAEARLAQAAEARRARLDAAIAARRGAADAALEVAVAEARQRAVLDVLAARDEVLARVRARARERLARATGEAAGRAVLVLADGAASYLGEGGGTVRCAPTWEATLTPLAHRLGLSLEAEDGMPAGSVLSSADGRLVIDATLPTLLERRWPDEAITVAHRVDKEAGT